MCVVVLEVVCVVDVCVFDCVGGVGVDEEEFVIVWILLR